MFSLEKIIPFNKCFYYNCVHSCLFAIIEANGGDFRKIMLSGVPHFAVDNNTQRIYTEFDFFGDYEKLLFEQGIISERFLHMDIDECIEYAINSIHNDKPIIINVDCYELIYREDLFHRGEWPHSLLVFGYNEDCESFKVMDQPTRDAVEFRIFYISKNALKCAVECYNKNRANSQMYFGDMIASFDCKYPGRMYDNKTLLLEWKESRKNAICHIQDGNLRAKEQLLKIMKRLPEEEYRNLYGDSILEGLNDIIKQKRWENFLLKELRSDIEPCYIFHSELLQKWILLRKKIALIVLSSKQRKKTMESILNMIDMLFELEDSFALAMGD